MLVWVLRFIALLGSPIITYYLIAQDWRGVLAGLICGIVLVGMEMLLESINLMTLIVGISGAVLGIILARLLDAGVLQLDNESIVAIWKKFHVLSQFLLALLGMIIAISKTSELEELDKDISSVVKKRGSAIKFLDTSAIIDGRIIDICDTHFISGQLVVPRFVLNNLHSLADSQDPLKRAKGRRGLDILARLQENKEIPFKVMDKDIPELKEIDTKVIRIAREMGACVVTTDFNMHKLAALEGVTVLNINDLATALKPVVLPGENMAIFVMKEGKEKEQGVGYLDDGTMVVVEEGRRYIGKRIEVAVYSILQTSAGRMIFTKARPQEKPTGLDADVTPQKEGQ